MSETPRVREYRIVRTDDEVWPWSLYWDNGPDERSSEEYETIDDVLDRIKELEEEA